MMRFGLICVMVVLGGAGSTLAHDFFLVPSPARLSAPGQTLVRMHVTEGFPGQTSPWRTDKTMSLCAVGPGGQTVQPLAWPAEGADGATIALKQPGTYLVALTLSPSSISLEGAVFTEYLTHEGHRDLIRARAERGTTEAEARERYSRYVKTIVVVAGRHPAPADHVTRPIGQRLEIVPSVAPSQVRPGQKLTIQVLFQGRPLPGAFVSATHAGYTGKTAEHAAAHFAFSARTDQDGRLEIPITHPGLQLIRLTHMIELTDNSDFDYESFWASLTFEVPSEPAPPRVGRPGKGEAVNKTGRNRLLSPAIRG